MTNENRALLQAVAEKDLNRFMGFVDHGADVNAHDPEGNTPLILAMYYGFPELAQWLIERGADVNRHNPGDYSALHLAIIWEFEELARNLIAGGAELNTQDPDGDTPLMLAMIYNFETLARELIQSGAELNTQNSDGDTPLLIAIKKGFGKIVYELIVCGADVNENTLQQLIAECLKDSADQKKIDALKLVLDRPEILETTVDKKTASDLAVLLNTSSDEQENIEKNAEIENLVANAFKKTVEEGEIILEVIPLSHLLSHSAGVISDKYNSLLLGILDHVLDEDIGLISVGLEQLKGCVADNDDYLSMPDAINFIERIQNLYKQCSDSFSATFMNELVGASVFVSTGDVDKLYAPVAINPFSVRQQIAVVINYAYVVADSAALNDECDYRKYPFFMRDNQRNDDFCFGDEQKEDPGSHP